MDHASGMTGYLGNKGVMGAYQAIIGQMPPHDTYIETHLGSGVVLREKPQAVRTIGIEVDPATIAQFPLPANAELHIGDCVEFLENFDFASAGRVLIYADPPYVRATRSHPDSVYRHEYTDDDHVRLINTLRSVPAAVILSGYPSDLYASLLGDWRTIEFQAATRGGPRTEKLWMNFAAGPVNWTLFAGANFTERQRIKRKAERWASKFAALNASERLAVLAAMLEAGRKVPADPYDFRPKKRKDNEAEALLGARGLVDGDRPSLSCAGRSVLG